MRWVPEAVTRPMRCAVIPSVAGRHPDGFIDTGSELPGKGDQFDEHVYVSVVACRELARLIGWYSPDDMSEVLGICAELREELAQAKAEATELRAALDGFEKLRAVFETGEVAA